MDFWQENTFTKLLMGAISEIVKGTPRARAIYKLFKWFTSHTQLSSSQTELELELELGGSMKSR